MSSVSGMALSTPSEFSQLGPGDSSRSLVYSRKASFASQSSGRSVHSSNCLADEDSDTRRRKSRKKVSSESKVNKARSPTDEELYDTDLEIEDEKTDYHVAGPLVYLETCKELGVVPATYFFRHINDSVIRMRHHGLGAQGAKAMAVPLVNNTTVVELDLEDNWLEGEGAHYIAEMLKENLYLNNVNLAENRLGSLGAEVICEALINNTCITSINLSGNKFQDKDAPYFAAALLENNTVRYLNLSHNDLGVDCGEQLMHAIGENETLELLDLSWNRFRGRTGVALVDAIKVNSRLKKVNLAWNGLGNEAAVSVKECLEYNRVLTTFDITSNRITFNGAAIIAKGLDANENLSTFRMGKNPIGTVGAMMILSAINNERSVLKELDLTEVSVDKEFRQLYRDMQQSRELKVLHGQVIGDYVIKGPPLKPQTASGSGEDLSAEELAALQRLEDFLENDPMARIMHHLKKKNLRLLDLFNQFDKDKSYTITIAEFKKGVKGANIGLSDEQIDDLINKLDAGAKDGMIDYRELSEGTAKAQVKHRRMARRLLDKLENGSGLLAARTGSAKLQRLLPALSRSLNALKISPTAVSTEAN